MKDFIRQAYEYISHSSNGLNMMLEVLPPVFAVALIYFLIRRNWSKRRLGAEFNAKRKDAFWNEAVRLLLVCEISAIVFIGIFPYDFWSELWHFVLYRSYNPTFNEGGAFDWRNTAYIAAWIEYGRIFPADLDDLVLNIIFFVPFGLFLPFTMKKPALWKVTLIGFLFTLLVETSQMFTNHCSDINDVICNTLGAFAGYLIYLVIKVLFPGFVKKCRVTVWEKTI